VGFDNASWGPANHPLKAGKRHYSRWRNGVHGLGTTESQSQRENLKL